MKPTVGGMPPSEIMNIVSASPVSGCRKPRPARSETSTGSSLPRPIMVRIANAPRFIAE
jgi:hypothetical protein